MSKFMRRFLITVIVISFILMNLLEYHQYKKDTDPEYIVNEIYKQLNVNIGQYGMPPIIVINNSQINAWTDGKQITVTTALVEFVNYDKDMLALIIAHEMAHNILDHLYVSNRIPTVYKEAQADKLGAYIVLKSGYDVCQGKNFFDLFKSKYGDDPGTDHPAAAYRYDQLDFPWCH